MACADGPTNSNLRAPVVPRQVDDSPVRRRIQAVSDGPGAAGDFARARVVGTDDHRPIDALGDQ